MLAQKTPEEEVIKEYFNDSIQSYHMNAIGETNLLFSGQLEEKPVYKYRVAQGLIDLLASHFECMLRRGKTK